MAGLKTYTPLDMEGNQITNLGDPAVAQDAVTKAYADALVPLTLGGDTLFQNPAGSLLLRTFAGPYTITDPSAEFTRVLALPSLHTIRVAWEATGGYFTDFQPYLRSYASGGGAPLQDITCTAGTGGSWAAFSQDIVLGAGEVELGFYVVLTTWQNPCGLRNLTFTDMSVSAHDRLPIGAEGSALQVVAGLPAWVPQPPLIPGYEGEQGDEGQMGPVGPAGAVGTTIRHAASVPSGAPVSTELPIAFDSTAVTGGLYIWDGTAWVKGSTIP